MRVSSRLTPLLVVVLLGAAFPAAAQVQQEYLGRPIADIRLELGGRPTSDADIRDVLETRVGDPLAMTAVRETLIHLMALSRFENVEVSAEPDPRGVVLVYTLVPLRTVRSMVFRGPLGLDESLVRSEVTDRYGNTPALGRADDIARTLEGLYRDHGYEKAAVTPHVEIQDGTRARLVFDVDHGPRARIGAIKVEGDGRLSEGELLTRLAVKSGGEYDPSDVTRRASAYVEGLRGRGFYAAAVDVTPRFLENVVNLDIAATRGPHITLQFTGDALPKDKIEQLAPIKTEKSVDQDILEDWSGNIVQYLRSLGYRNADATFDRRVQDGGEQIIFDVRQGRRHVIEAVEVTGNQAISRERIVKLLGVQPGQPLVQRTIDAGVTAVVADYLAAGFTTVGAKSVIAARSSTPAEARDALTVQITEGPKTIVSSVRFTVNGGQVPASELPVGKVTVEPGAPFFLPALTTQRDEILRGYLNGGYESVTVTLPDPQQMISADRTRADVRYDIRTGPQFFVDHILIAGDNRTKASTIRDELQFTSGDPLSLEKLRASEMRLGALGLFRRVRVTELQQGGTETRRDVLVIVDEAPTTSIAYGGGIEVARRLRRDASGLAVPAYELAPRGLFEVGRRNLWGGNRSINFTSSVAVRPSSTDVVGTGLKEYRALGTYREPKIFSGLFDLLVTGGVEQTVRTSYAFNRRSVYTQIAHRLSPTLSLYGQYSLERTHVFNEQVTEEEQLLIDKLFPRVRISRVSATIARDTRRDDPFDPSAGMLASVEGSVAPRALGSEVGFAKTQAQAFVYRQLTGRHRTVFAGGVRLGLAAGFERTTVTGEILHDVPISERFFSGNSVRGFVADRLGRPGTLTPVGFPTGGNGLLVFNVELRTRVWKDLGAVAFVDAGNVFLKASDVNPTLIRPGVGFGLRYKSPLGPIRLDVGFNPDRRYYGNGTREPLTSIYFGLGQAF
jgi:outer membrane protein insertion porin family